MERTDNSEKKLWRPSWKGVIITLLVGSNIVLIRIIEALVYKGQSLENKNNQLWMNLNQSSADQLCDGGIRMQIKKQLCVNTGEKPDVCALCPSGWLWDRENCYNISSGGEYRTWNESREVCEGMGAHLLVIEDREQQEFINRSINQQTDRKFWIGLYRDGDGWRWVDGRLYNTGLFHLSGSSGDCVWWEADSGYNEDRCQSQHSWICQKRSLKI
ncbi:killer cell lectin-like receptor subfamily B member 1B allele C isoform X2 [Aquarana catesbeiana]|uniref:killer cell lectin-like receptor subfamily B member 1B allele C isoform X2 n=1 Tax=Aquarana catesbeiana TaxID=8400 RepID=UPI003CCA6AC1